MNAVRCLVLAVLVVPLLSGCGALPAQPATPFPESMKGYELYSWQDGREWNFALLTGTNREKTRDEVKGAQPVLRGVDQLTSALEQMPSGAYITWSSRETLSLPPEEVIAQVEKVCADRGLILQRAGLP